MSRVLLTIAIRHERDIVLARQRARDVAEQLGLDTQDQARVSTSVSEIARNAFLYAAGGTVSFQVEGATAPQLLIVTIEDQGPGISDVPLVLAGRFRSRTGLGLGILGARRLMDQLEIQSSSRGTTVRLKKLLPRGRRLVDEAAADALARSLAGQDPADLVEEVQRQNQELLLALDELKRRQDELVALNHELEDTNRGVVALYAELDEKADHLRRADEIKTRFISNMSHEFRTPVNSIQALAHLLLRHSDGPLASEQERQVEFILRSADALSELVNDLLDLAKVEAGKTVVRPTQFELANMFGALRGMLRPLLVNESVSLVFEEPEDMPVLFTDEAKLSQILRNLVSNALKFTERGEVRVAARLSADRSHVTLSVTDTGIGIAPEDQERCFQEFSQVDHPIQRRVRGTGLGLPLCRRLAELLGGHVELISAVGAGSTFTVVIPVAYEDAPTSTIEDLRLDPTRLPLLVVDDAHEDQLIYGKHLADSRFQVLAARNLREAREVLGAVRPRVIVLDIMLGNDDAWGFIAELKRRHETADIPVAVVSTVDDPRKGLALGADAYLVKPVGRQELIRQLTRLAFPQEMRRILIVDDEEVSRYILRRHLAAPHHLIEEASTGMEALRMACEAPPDVICLDLGMPDMSGQELLARLRSRPETEDVPVVVVTSARLTEHERASLLHDSTDLIPKDDLTGARALSAVESAMRSRAEAR